jgi:hypothetical protein
MAREPAWRGSVDTWRSRVGQWLTRSAPEDLLSVDIFFDATVVSGEVPLADGLIADARARAAGAPGFLKLLAASSPSAPASLGFFEDRDPVNGSKTNGAQTNYDDLYADILLWLRKGWIDYVAPQLYWEFGHRVAPYEILLDWWSKHTYGRNCYIGLGIYRANSNAAWRDNTQLPKQIEALRNSPNIQGMVFYSSTIFNKNPNGWSDSLRLNYFKEPAAMPEMGWIK